MNDASADHKNMRKAARGSLWAIIGFGGGQGMRLVSNLIVSRLVPREAFGIMLLVNVVLLGIGQFSDTGVRASLIQNHREDARFLNTAWTIQFIRGFFLTAAAAAVALPMAAFYGEPILAVAIPFAGLTGIIGGLRSTRLATANRKLAIKQLTLIEFASKVFGTVGTIGWALINPSVWALIGGGLIANTAKTVASHTMVPGIRNWFAWDKEAVSALFSFGKWVFFSTLLGFLATQSDQLIFGRLFPLQLMGVYYVANLIARTPQTAFRHMALTVNFPLYSQTIRDNGNLAVVFRRSRRRVLIIAGCIVAGLIAGAPTGVALLWPEKFSDAGWMVQLLAVGVWFNVLSATIEAALLARGQSRQVAAASVAKLAGMALLMPLGYILYDIPGVIAGFAFADVFRYAASAFAGVRANLGAIGQEVWLTTRVALSAAMGWMAGYGSRMLDFPLLIEAIAITIGVIAVWAPSLRAVLRRGGQWKPPANPAADAATSTEGSSDPPNG